MEEIYLITYSSLVSLSSWNKNYFKDNNNKKILMVLGYPPLGMTNTENAPCHSLCCVGKGMQKEFSLWPWEWSHKPRALERVDWGHFWIIKSINVHTAIAPVIAPVLKDLSKTLKYIWDSGRAPESCTVLGFFSPGTLKVGIWLLTAINFSDQSYLYYYLPSSVVRQLTTAQRTPFHVQTL